MRGRPPKLIVSTARRMWADAENCTKPVLDLLFRTADARRMVLTLIASEPITWPNSAYVRSLVIAPGQDAVNTRIAGLVGPGDLVVTNDAALTALVTSKSARVVPSRDASGLAGQLDSLFTVPPAPVAKPAASEELEG